MCVGGAPQLSVISFGRSAVAVVLCDVGAMRTQQSVSKEPRRPDTHAMSWSLATGCFEQANCVIQNTIVCHGVIIQVSFDDLARCSVHTILRF